MATCSNPLRYLAWLDLANEAGAEYCEAMNLMGDYVAARRGQVVFTTAEGFVAWLVRSPELCYHFQTALLSGQSP